MKDIFTVKDLDLVFARKPGRVFEALDAGKNREQIQKETKDIVAVQGATFSVENGEILVIMGLSGSGKSSLLRCLNGMNGRRKTGTTRGQIHFQALGGAQPVDITRCTEKLLREIRRHQIAMVFQQFGLMPWRTVFENVAYPLEVQNIPKDEKKQRVEEKIALVGLSPWKNRFPHELSGGMQQRVGLARAFATDAPVLLMDEPFSALDPLHRRHLQDEVLLLQKKLKKTIVFVTHDFSEALRLASRIAIMDSGKILQLARPQELISNPSCDRVRQFATA